MGGIIKAINNPAKINPNWDSKNLDPSSSLASWRVYNIGNNKPVQLKKYMGAQNHPLGKSKINYLPLQMGDILTHLQM